MVTLKTNKNKKTAEVFRNKILPYIYLLPIFVMLSLFVLRAFGFAIEKSFYRYDGGRINEFIGFDNYIRLFKDPLFYKSIKNMIFFMALVIVKFSMPIIAAELIVNLKKERLHSKFQIAFTIPMVVPHVITYLVWKFMYYPGIGVFANVCKSFGMSALDIPLFLGDESLVKFFIWIIGFPWIPSLEFLIVFSALKNLDKAQIEASIIDGCPTIKRIFYIDIPTIMPQLKTLFALSIIGLIQNYENIFILTQGGPNNASLVPGLYMYNVSFVPSGTSESLYGYACAMALVMFVISFILSALVMRDKKEKGVR